MKITNTLAFVTLLSTILLGCTSAKPSYSPSAFKTRISDSGLKHFELRSAPPRNRQSNRSQPTRENPGRRNANQFKKFVSKMTDAASEIIQENEYCRTGFWVLDFDLDTRGYFLRGECNELATKEDKTNYPDTISNW